jgi:hypothetical protein
MPYESHTSPDAESLGSSLKAAAIARTYDEYGCAVNVLTLPELFDAYERAGFLYQEKMRLLAPYWDLIRDNWRRALRAGEVLLYIVSTRPDGDGRFATITSWRSARRGWVTQHLVSSAGPLASRAVMLGTQAVRIRDGLDCSHQNWFRPTNRYADRLFGSMVSRIGREFSTVLTYDLFRLPRNVPAISPGDIYVRPYEPFDRDALLELVVRARGEVYVKAEDLSEDIEFAEVNSYYALVGLSRTRRVWLAYMGGSGRLVGAAIAYRGPLGLNFSFLENRCDIVACTESDSEQTKQTIGSLLGSCLEAYEDFELNWIPITIRSDQAESVRELGLPYLRQYRQGIWLQDGFHAWYRHVELFYSRLSTRTARRWAGPRVQKGSP